MQQNERNQKIKELIIDRLNLDIDIASIQDDMLLFGTDEEDSLGLDSVDALELAVGIMNEFEIEVSDDDMHIFQSVATISQFIAERMNATIETV